MYVTPRQKRRYFWTSLILIIGLPVTTLAAIWAVRYFSLAGGSETPNDVIISNLSSNSISISWGTEADASGSITVNGGKGDSAPFIDIRGTDRRKTHHVDIVDLEPAKDYTFIILSNDTRYADENGKPFKFRTAPITSQTPIPTPVYGAVEGSNKEDALVYVVVEGLSTVFPASSATTTSGKWIVDLSALRDPATRELVKLEKDTSITLIAKGAGVLGGTVSGTYGELIDDEGQMKTSIQLSDVPTDSLLSVLPQGALITGVVQSGTNNPPVEEPTDEEPVDEEPEVPDDVIATDVEWESIEGTETGSISNPVVGESSVQVTNITDSGFTVVWISSTPTEGSVKYGTSQSSLTETAIDERDSAVSTLKYTAHSVKLSRLQPETKYFFEIHSDSSVIRDNGTAFNQTTFKTLASPPEFKTITGKLTGVSNPSDAVVVVSIEQGDGNGSSGESTLTSTIPDGSGNWVATLGDIRTSSGNEYYSYSDSDKVSASVSSLSIFNPKTTTVSNSLDNGITLATDPESERKIVKVPALSNYFVYSGAVGGTGSGGTPNTVDQKSDYTPKTAVTYPLLLTIVFGFISMIVGISVFLRSQRKYKVVHEKNGMMSSVI